MKQSNKEFRNTKGKGFTIIEVLVVVAILGILAAIAIPAVTKYVTDARRSDGKVALLEAAQAMERYFTTNNFSYKNATISALMRDNYSKYYTLCFTNVDLTQCNNSNSDDMDYIIKAVPDPNESQASDTDCSKMYIDHIGNRGAKDASGGDSYEKCWRY
ncbi:type IV pilin protein [Desulfonatronum thioautotrophicum]|uniref:type IV pilin protein n=1 Tax=Desulfonatronum thioautotrophicum TaxID=617001 RepID=UPI00069AE94B|nr:type IV pilin protein [Desulfonatronum thioautotrophicum]